MNKMIPSERNPLKRNGVVRFLFEDREEQSFRL